MTIKAVLFDLDGTLVDSNDFHVTAWQEAFAGYGFDISRETIHGQIGKGADMLLPALLPDADAETREALAAAHGEIFKDRFLPRVEPFPAGRELLQHTRDSGRLVVLASSASQAELEHYLDLLDARGIVTASTSGDDVDHTKPAPDIFAAALAKLPGIGAHEAIVIGDTPYDVEAAAGCGMAAIALRSGGFADDRLMQAGAQVIYDDVAAVLGDFAEAPISG